MLDTNHCRCRSGTSQATCSSLEEPRASLRVQLGVKELERQEQFSYAKRGFPRLSDRADNDSSVAGREKMGKKVTAPLFVKVHA